MLLKFCFYLVNDNKKVTSWRSSDSPSQVVVISATELLGNTASNLLEGIYFQNFELNLSPSDHNIIKYSGNREMFAIFFHWKCPLAASSFYCYLFDTIRLIKNCSRNSCQKWLLYTKCTSDLAPPNRVMFFQVNWVLISKKHKSTKQNFITWKSVFWYNWNKHFLRKLKIIRLLQSAQIWRLVVLLFNNSF